MKVFFRAHNVVIRRRFQEMPEGKYFLQQLETLKINVLKSFNTWLSSIRNDVWKFNISRINMLCDLYQWLIWPSFSVIIKKCFNLNDIQSAKTPSRQMKQKVLLTKQFHMSLLKMCIGLSIKTLIRTFQNFIYSQQKGKLVSFLGMFF